MACQQTNAGAGPSDSDEKDMFATDLGNPVDPRPRQPQPGPTESDSMWLWPDAVGGVNLSGMTVVPLASDERLIAAFARYHAAWTAQGDELISARLELCEALLEVGEMLAPELHEQMAADRAALEERVAVSA